MFVKDLMEKLSKMNPEQDLIVEGLEDEVETTEEETVETPEEPKSVWDRELTDDDFNDKESQGVYNIIKNAHDYKVGETNKIKAPGAGIDAEDAGITADFNNNNLSTKKKLKTIAKWMAIEAIQDGVWTHGGYGRHFDDETELAKYDDYKKKYDDWVESSKYDPVLDVSLDSQMDRQFGEDEEEIDECGSACGKITEEAEKCEKCGKEPCECEKELDECGGACAEPIKEEAEEPVVESEEEPLEESAEAIEARLNEQMKTDYQKDLESISDFLF